MSDPIDSLLAHFWVHSDHLTWYEENGVVETTDEVRGIRTTLRLGERNGVLIRNDRTDAFSWSRRLPWIQQMYRRVRVRLDILAGLD